MDVMNFRYKKCAVFMAGSVQKSMILHKFDASPIVGHQLKIPLHLQQHLRSLSLEIFFFFLVNGNITIFHRNKLYNNNYYSKKIKLYNNSTPNKTGYHYPLPRQKLTKLTSSNYHQKHHPNFGVQVSIFFLFSLQNFIETTLLKWSKPRFYKTFKQVLSDFKGSLGCRPST